MTLRTRGSRQNPHRGFSREGQPLCYEHRLTRCYHCEKLFPQGEMRQVEVGKREEYVAERRGPLRVEPVLVWVCRGCAEDAPQTAGQSRRSFMPGYLLIAGVLALTLWFLFRGLAR
jgi:hypothetical protein